MKELDEKTKDFIVKETANWLKENTYFYVNDFTGTLYEDLLVKSYLDFINNLCVHL